MTEQQLHAGSAVYDIGGETIGQLHGYDAQSDCAVIRSGLLVHADFYIPLRDIRGNDALGGLHLRLYKDDLVGNRYAASAPTTRR